MALLLAPYSNAMRLGQGFNSYTQQICVDDAVKIDPDRAENVVTNDGTTMRIMAERDDKLSAWNRLKEVIEEHNNDPAKPIETVATPNAVTQSQLRPTVPLTNGAASTTEEMKQLEQQEKARLSSQREYRRQLEKEAREEDYRRQREEREEQRKIREERRHFDAQRREEIRQAINKAATDKGTALTLEELNKIKAQNQFAERFSGIIEDNGKYVFDASAPRGTSQSVVYSSRFIDRLSDLTDDMSVSGALSIKAAKFGGSGRGSFVNSDKFKESDLNFYISVKVINQTVNFKDALVYQSMRSAAIGSEKHAKVYGDSFISGFVEGGEFNALVSMKVLNKAKLTDIKAEAKVALTAGPVDVTAEANVGIARSNIETNTETTIQVSWCGGGHIKPMEEPWNITTILQAAARFPDLVADAPQRTYAILTRYEALRSFSELCPASYTPLQYENAQIYTNALMDSFMSYKALYKRLGEQISNVQSKILEIDPWPSSSEQTVTAVSSPGQAAAVGDLTRFEATIKGLNDARKAIRQQMVLIVNEVDLIERDPKIATDPGHKEPFQAPLTFETRLPETRVPSKLLQSSNPLGGKRIIAKTQTEEELRKAQEKNELDTNQSALISEEDRAWLNEEEKTKFAELVQKRPTIGDNLRVSAAAPKSTSGTSFNNLDFLQADWSVQSVTVSIRQGALGSIGISYENGVVLEKGKKHSDSMLVSLDSFSSGERITSAVIEHGIASTNKEPRVLGLRLFTNRGRKLLGVAAKSEILVDGRIRRDGYDYEQVKTLYLDAAYATGTLVGFFGRTDTPVKEGGVLRLGVIWGNTSYGRVAIGAVDTGPIVADTEYLRKEIVAAQAGVVAPASWTSDGSEPNEYRETPVTFTTPFSSPPRVITALSRVSQRIRNPVQIRMFPKNVTSAGFLTIASTTAGTRILPPALSWITLPESDIRFETGNWDSYILKRVNAEATIEETITFSKPFKNPPLVLPFFTGIDIPGGWRSILVSGADAKIDSFKLIMGTWAKRLMNGARVSWLAFEPVPGRAEGGTVPVSQQDGRKVGEIKFAAEFAKPPSIIFGIRHVDVSEDRDMGLDCTYRDVTRKGFKYECGSMKTDHSMVWTDFCWAALESN